MTDQQIINAIFDGLKSEDAAELKKTCGVIRDELKGMDPSQRAMVADGLISLFYLDSLNPDYVEVIDCAENLLMEMGADAVPVLIENLTDTDFHADFLIAQTLSKIGAPAVAVLKERFRTELDPFQRSMALFAMSKIDDPALIDILPEVISTLDHENPHIRDMAAYAIGTMIECIGGVCLTPDTADEAFEKVMSKVADSHANTRAKMVLAIGKLAKMGYLDDEKKARALKVLESILGIDDMHKWDRAFIVRKEAEEAYFQVTGNKPAKGGPG